MGKRILSIDNPLPPELGGTGRSDGLNASSVIWTNVNSNITLAINNNYLIDTSAPRILTLPALSVSNYGQAIKINDISSLAATNRITINTSGSDTIIGASNSLVIDVNNTRLDLIATSSGWRILPGNFYLLSGLVGSLLAPTLTWTTSNDATDLTPSFSVALISPQAGDEVVIQIDTVNTFAGATAISDTIENLSIVNPVEATTSTLTAGTYYVRARVDRTGTASVYSNVITMTLTAAVAANVNRFKQSNYLTGSSWGITGTVTPAPYTGQTALPSEVSTFSPWLIEGSYFNPLHSNDSSETEPVCLSFYARTMSGTDTLHYAGRDFNLTTTWQRFSAAFTTPDANGNYLDYHLFGYTNSNTSRLEMACFQINPGTTPTAYVDNA